MKRTIFVVCVAFIVLSTTSCTKECECKNEAGEVIVRKQAGGRQTCVAYNYNEERVVCSKK